jgi:hypothetical protein
MEEALTLSRFSGNQSYLSIQGFLVVILLVIVHALRSSVQL